MWGRAADIGGVGAVSCAIESSGKGRADETTAGSSAISAKVVGRLVSYTIRSGHFPDASIRILGLNVGLLPLSIGLAGRYAFTMISIESRNPPTAMKYRKRGICADPGSILFLTLSDL